MSEGKRMISISQGKTKLKCFIKGNKNKLTYLAIIMIVAALGVFIFKESSIPKLKLQGPSRSISSTYREEIIIPAVLSNLPDNVYPAANLAVNFDKDKLEFVGVRIGTMKTYNNYDSEIDDMVTYKIPQWSYNTEVSNQEGQVRTMYLDTTAGKNSYVRSGFEKGTQDMPLQLVFKLKDSVISGDELKVEIEEAAFATINGDMDKTTLSTKENYGKLKVEDTKIIIE